MKLNIITDSDSKILSGLKFVVSLGLLFSFIKYLNSNYFILNVVLGAGTFFMVHVIVETVLRRRNGFIASAGLLKSLLTDINENYFFSIVLTCVYSICVLVFNVVSIEPELESVKSLYSKIISFNDFIYLLGVFVYIQTRKFSLYYDFVLSASLLVLGSSFCVGLFGDSVVGSFTADPRAFLASLGSALFLAFTFLASFFFAFKVEKINESFKNVLFFKKRKFSQRNDVVVNNEQFRESVISHEAGHVVFFGVLDELPDGFSVSVPSNFRINAKAEDFGVTSFFITEGNLDQWYRKSVNKLEWYMKMLLGGQAGEEISSGRTTIGNRKDFAVWLNLADNYLSSGVEGEYYAYPDTDFQKKIREEKLMRLLKRHKEESFAFIEQNQKAFDEIRNELRKKSKLNKKDAERILDEYFVKKTA